MDEDENKDEDEEGGVWLPPQTGCQKLQTAGTKIWKNVTCSSPLQHTHTPLHLSLHPVPQECKNTQTLLQPSDLNLHTASLTLNMWFHSSHHPATHTQTHQNVQGRTFLLYAAVEYKNKANKS